MKRMAGLAVLSAALIGAGEADAASCRGYPDSERMDVVGRIEALRLVEREAADRLAGHDTRTYSYLADEARKVADAVASPAALAEEDSLSRCRNYIAPVRRVCGEAARTLAAVLAEQETGAASTASRQSYTQAMQQCERIWRLAPLSTAIRVNN